MRSVRRAFWIAVFVAALVVGWRFAHANRAAVSVDYLLGVTPEFAVWAVVLAAFLLGAATAGILASFRVAQLRLATRRYRKAVAGLEAEVHQLRHLPLSSAIADHSAEEPREIAPPEGALERGA